VIIAKFFFNFGINEILSNIKCLVVLSHCVAIGLLYPDIMIEFFKQFLNFITFDAIPTEYVIDPTFNFTNIPFNSNFEELRYESQYFIRNIGSAILVILLMPFQIGILHMLSACNKLHPKLKKLVMDNFFKLKWNGFFAFYDDMWFILFFCALLNLHQIEFFS
jgi:ethanolamine transporter EutH